MVIRSFGIFPLLFLLVSTANAAAEQFAVIHVDPPENEIAAGVTYETGEFIFVPSGTTAVLMDEDANRYIIEGLEAVAADMQSLEPFQLEGKELEFLTITDFLFGKKEVIIGGSRDIIQPKSQDPADHPAWRIHTELLSKYVPGERYCQIGDKLIIKRSDRSAVDFAQFESDGAERTKQWETGTSELQFENFELEEGTIRTVTLKTKDKEAQVEILGVPISLLDQSPLSAAGFLARRNCTLQALMISDQ